MNEDSSWVNLSLQKYNELYDKAKKAVEGWRPIIEYMQNRDKYDWVLIKYFDGDFECVPCVAELRDSGWHDRSGNVLPFRVTHFFDMQQLDQ